MAISQRANSGWPVNPISWAQVTRSVAAKMIQPGGIGGEGLTRQIAQPGGFEFADTVLDAGVLTVAQLEAGELSGDDAGRCVGDERRDPQTVSVGESQLGSRVRSHFAQYQPRSGGPTSQVDQGDSFGDPCPVTDLAVGVECGIPALCAVESIDGILDAGIDGMPERKPTPALRHASAKAWVAPAESQRTDT